ncbi:MAG: tetratricopeptide repeat protein [Bacteroidales bacterium]|nr:tetratricopeptide repeat protein [Bacteroidales bacterium]
MLNQCSDSALYYAEKALQLSKTLKYKKGTAYSYLSLGSVSIVEGKLDKSFDCFMNALNIFEKDNDSIGISKSYLKLGYTYYHLKEFTKAQKYNMLSLQFLKSSDYKELQNTYNNVGLVYSSLDMPDSALYYYQKSISSSKNINGRKNIFYELGNIANLHLNKGNYKKALETYLEVKKMSEEYRDKSSVSISFCNLSEVYFLMAEKEQIINKKKNYNRLSVSYADSALTTAKSVNSLILINYSYERLFQSYKGLNDYKNAFLYLDSFVTVKDSLFDISKISEFEKLENKYQTEKQHLEIESYKKTENLNEAIIKKQNQTILFGIISIVIILGLFLFLILSYRKKLKTNKEINEKNKAILNQRSEIAAQRDKMSELAFELKRANKKKNKANKRLSELNESVIKQRKEIASQRDKMSELAFELKKLNKTKNKFISVLAHDLKNPFQSILGFSELIKEQTLKGKFDKVNMFSDYYL